MSGTVFLHIGAGKTGTSSLQRFLKHFQTEIEAQGFYFVKTGLDLETVAHHQLALSFGFTRKDDDRFCEDTSLSLTAEVENIDDTKIIISSENFHSHVTHTKLRNLHKAFKGKQVKVILYARRQDEWVDSAFRQLCEGGNTHSINEIVEKVKYNRLIDYHWQVRVWEQHFGLGNVVLRLYPNKSAEFDVIDDFAQVLGLNARSMLERFNDRHNPSLSPAEAEIFRIVNCVSSKKREVCMAILTILREDETVDPSKFHFISEQTRVELMGYYERGNALLAQEYFQREDGKLFD